MFEELLAEGEAHPVSGWDFSWPCHAVPGFSIKTHRSCLRDLHGRIVSNGPVAVPQRVFWLDALKADRTVSKR